MNSFTFKRSVQSVLFLVLVVACRAETARAESGGPEAFVVPMLSSPSVKNGETLFVRAAVKTSVGVRDVLADLGGIETIHLQRASDSSDSNLWTGAWKAHGLEEKIYTLGVRVIDTDGATHENRTLQFSDPAAGISTAGTTAYPNGGMRRVAALDFNGSLGESEFACSAIDPVKGYAYFGSWVAQPSIVKIALNGSAAPTRVAGLRLSTGEDFLETAAIDATNGYVYFGTHNDDTVDTAHIVKVAVGAGDAAPTKIGTLDLTPGESHLHCVCIDTANGYAYFGGSHEQGRIIKIGLNGAGTPIRVAGILLNPDEKYPRCAVIDVAHGYAYFGLRGSPGRVVKVALGVGAAPPVRVGAVTLNPGEDDLNCAVIDTVNGYAYFGTDTATGHVIKIALGGGNAPPVRVDAVTLNANEGRLRSAVIDTTNSFAYFGTSPDAGTPSTVIKVALNATGAPTRVDALTMNAGDDQFNTAVMDPLTGNAYWGSFSGNGRITKVSLTQKAVIKATKMTMPETGDVASVRLYSHDASGKVRLAIYSDTSPKTLLWDSGDVTNSILNDVINVPITSGTPAALNLPAGTYWLAWQSDSLRSVPSFTAGAAGSGFFAVQDFGAYPASLADTAITATSETWTEYIVYHTADEQRTGNVPPVLSSSPTATPNPGHAGAQVLLSVAADDADFDTLTYTWDFGDGTSGSGASSFHVYMVEGHYNASVTVSDGNGGTANASVLVQVDSPAVGGGADSDGDGFSDAVELAAGSDPHDPTSTPSNNDHAQQARDLALSKIAIKLNFAKPGSDSIAFSGSLPITAGFVSAGQKIVVDVGGVVAPFTLDAKGSAKSGVNSFKITIKAKKGVVADQTAKFAVKMSKGTYAKDLANEDLTGAVDAKNQSRKITVTVLFDGMIFQAQRALVYTAKAGKTGAAK